jgi:hypothetical protein
MYIVNKKNGSFTAVVKRETLKSAVDAVEAFSATHDLVMRIDPISGYPEAVDYEVGIPEVHAWIELEPYAEVELKQKIES